MAVKLSNILKDKPGDTSVDPDVREYEDRFGMAQGGTAKSEEGDYEEFNNLYYDLVTDFFEYGWGRSFHFAPRVPGESFEASLARHERHMAHRARVLERTGRLSGDREPQAAGDPVARHIADPSRIPRTPPGAGAG